MKRIIAAFAVILNCSLIMAQTEFDALKIVQTDITGTARYMGMAGAFGALGGDASAIKDNPGGLGVYRRSELTGTVNILSQQTGASWNNVNSYNDLYKLGFNNFAYVIACPTWRSEKGSAGLLSSNWSLSYNKLKSFDRRMTVKTGETGSSMTDYMGYFTNKISKADLTYTDSYEPFNNTSVPWLSVLADYAGVMTQNADNTWSSFLNSGEKVTPSYSLEEQGYVNEYSVGWSGNFSNLLYLGLNVNLQTLYYKADSKYSEVFGNGGGMDLENTIEHSGTGYNFNAGAIIVPVDYIRFGLAVHSPMFYSISTYNSGVLNFDNGTNKGYIGTPVNSSDNYYDYKVQSPMQVNLSAAYVYGKKGLISAEYVMNNYRGTRLIHAKDNNTDYTDENTGMQEMLNDSRTIKIGAEYRLTDNFSLRGGYANTSALNKSDAVKWMRYNTTCTDPGFFVNNNTDYFSGGLGYRESNWYIDFAYMYKLLNETYYPYNSTNLPSDLKGSGATVLTANSNITVTLGFKF